VIRLQKEKDTREQEREREELNATLRESERSERNSSGRRYAVGLIFVSYVNDNDDKDNGGGGDDAVKRLNMERRYRVSSYSVRCTSTRTSISGFRLDRVVRISLHFLGWNLNFCYPSRRSAAKEFKYK